MGVNASLVFSRGLPRKVATNVAATFRPKGPRLSLSPTQNISEAKQTEVQKLSPSLRVILSSILNPLSGRVGRVNRNQRHDAERFLQTVRSATLCGQRVGIIHHQAAYRLALQGSLYAQRPVWRPTRIQQKLTSRAPQVF